MSLEGSLVCRVVEASAAESEVDEEIEMERPPAESTNDGSSEQVRLWVGMARS